MRILNIPIGGTADLATDPDVERHRKTGKPPSHARAALTTGSTGEPPMEGCSRGGVGVGLVGRRPWRGACGRAADITGAALLLQSGDPHDSNDPPEP